MKSTDLPTENDFVRIVIDDDGRYWFEHGEKRFISAGINVILMKDGSDAADGRKYDVTAKYQGDPKLWADAIEARMKDWHFTTVASWSDQTLFNNTSLYYYRFVNFGGIDDGWGAGQDSRLIDVFSAEYEKRIDDMALKHVAPHASETRLIGYFANNELPWYGERGWPTSSSISLLTRYMELSADDAGKRELVRFLLEHYDNAFDELEADWDVDARSFEELLEVTHMLPRSKRSKGAVNAWAGLVADRFYKLCSEAIARHDPNHLMIGSRFANQAPKAVIEACGRYADVISVNHYAKSGDLSEERLGAIHTLTGKPILLTEFSWRAMENRSGCKNSMGADVTVDTQQDRADRYRSYVTEAMEQSFIMGYDYFQYFDQPPGGRFDGEDSNYGLVDIYDEPYETMIDAVRDVNARANEMHAGSEVRDQPFDIAPLVDFRPITVRKETSPLEQPILYAHWLSSHAFWGDNRPDTSVALERKNDRSLVFRIRPGDGWGCGISFKAAGVHPDGSGNYLGASTIRVRLKASRSGALFSANINESGHARAGDQVYDGHGHADGEAFHHVPVEAEAAWRTYDFKIANMELNPGHGNQRGNRTVDMDAIAEIGLFFPPRQEEFTIEWESIELR